MSGARTSMEMMDGPGSMKALGKGEAGSPVRGSWVAVRNSLTEKRSEYFVSSSEEQGGDPSIKKTRKESERSHRNQARWTSLRFTSAAPTPKETTAPALQKRHFQTRKSPQRKHHRGTRQPTGVWFEDICKQRAKGEKSQQKVEARP